MATLQLLFLWLTNTKSLQCSKKQKVGSLMLSQEVSEARGNQRCKTSFRDEVWKFFKAVFPDIEEPSKPPSRVWWLIALYLMPISRLFNMNQVTEHLNNLLSSDETEKLRVPPYACSVPVEVRRASCLGHFPRLPPPYHTNVLKRKRRYY